MNKNNDYENGLPRSACGLPRNDTEEGGPDYKAMYEAEHDRYCDLAEKLRETRRDYERKIEALDEYIKGAEYRMDILKAKLEMVQLIFGGGKE